MVVTMPVTRTLEVLDADAIDTDEGVRTKFVGAIAICIAGDVQRITAVLRDGGIRRIERVGHIRSGVSPGTVEVINITVTVHRRGRIIRRRRHCIGPRGRRVVHRCTVEDIAHLRDFDVAATDDCKHHHDRGKI